MARNNSKTTEEVQIRQLIDCWAGAIRICSGAGAKKSKVLLRDHFLERSSAAGSRQL
jgi:hypothetical protein